MSDKNSNKLSSTFGGSPLSSHGPKWSSLWDESYTPWDRGGPSLALHDLLTDRPDLVPRRLPQAPQHSRPRALVPGCGRGHDVLLLAAFGYDVVGMDFAPKAIEEAAENQRALERRMVESAEGSSSNDQDAALLDVYRASDRQGVPSSSSSSSRGEVRWVSGDFFDDAWLEECGVGREAKFDLIFDYTFLCALPLSARPQWAARMSSLLEPEGGRLVCLEFPSGKPLTEPGPPWGLTPDTYLALLSRPGDDIVRGPDGGIQVPEVRAEDGLRRLELIKPVRTHKSGTNEDGTVRDWIHVWAKPRAQVAV